MTGLARCELKAAGEPYPRTCPVCGLGLCQRMETVPRRNGNERMKDAATLLRDHLARQVADCIRDTGDVEKAKAMTDQPAWRFLGQIIGDVDPTP